MNESTRGDIGIYIALTTALIMLGSAVLLSLILVRQFTLTRDIVTSERAFYAANAGQEASFYEFALKKLPVQNLPGTITYGVAGSQQVASYTATVALKNNIPCGFSVGIFPDPNGAKRRLAFGDPVCP